MQNNFSNKSYIVFVMGGIIYLLLHLIGSYTASPLWWGVDSWRYLPGILPYVFFSVGLLCLVPAIQNLLAPMLKRLGHLVKRVPIFVWLAVSGTLFYIFRQKTFFLGDGQLRARNLQGRILFSFEEPFDTLIHSALHKLLHTVPGISGEDIYQWLSILSGVIAVCGIIYFLNRLYENSGVRWFIGSLIAASGAVQLFFGYVESYTIVNCLALLFLFSGLLMLKRGKPTIVPMLFLSVAVISHPVTVLLIPGALYAYIKVINKKEGIVSILKQLLKPTVTFVIIVSSLMAVFWIGKNMPIHFLEQYLHANNLLPLRSTGGLYGIFSKNHAVDMMNEICLIIPAWISLFFILPQVRLLKRTNSLLFLLLCSIGPFIFLSVFNPKLGYARDWDIFGIAAFPVTLLLGELVTEITKRNIAKIAFPLVLISLLHTAPWIWVNSSETESLSRFENISSVSFWTNSARSMAHESLASYFYDSGNFEKAAKHYQNAYGLTGNIRFFRNVISVYQKSGDIDSFQMFIEKNSSITEGHFYLGMEYIKRKLWASAQEQFEKVIAINPDYPSVHFQLGLTYVEKKQYDDGICEYREALKRNNNILTLSLIHNNLGNAYVLKNMFDDAVREYHEALKLKPDFSLAHYNLASFYYNAGIDSLALKHAELAQKYGFTKSAVANLLNKISSRQ